MGTITIKEMCEVMAHIDRKAKMMDGIYDSKKEDEVYKDLYKQTLRESGSYSLDTIEPKYLYAIHDAIDCYTLPACIRKRDRNDEDNSTDGNNELD